MLPVTDRAVVLDLVQALHDQDPKWERTSTGALYVLVNALNYRVTCDLYDRFGETFVRVSVRHADEANEMLRRRYHELRYHEIQYRIMSCYHSNAAEYEHFRALREVLVAAATDLVDPARRP